VQVDDNDGGAGGSDKIQVTVLNVAPTVEAGEDIAAAEGDTIEIAATFADPGLLDEHFAFIFWDDSDEAERAEVVFKDGKGQVRASHTYAGEGKFEVTVSVFDELEASGSDTLTVTVTDAVPVVEIGGEQSVVEGQTYTLLLDAFDPAGEAIVRWEIDWGDGSPLAIVDGNPETREHTFLGLGPATRTVTATAFDESGSSTTDTWAVSITPDYLEVVSVEPTATGFHARFDQAIDPTELNLYARAVGTLGAADVTFEGVSGLVRGSLIPDADDLGVTFVRTGSPLPTGEYTLVLSSRSNGFIDVHGRPLDGNGDGVNGDDFTTTLTIDVDPATAPVLRILDLARGPGQLVRSPANTGAGIPITITRAAGASSVTFELAYDSTMLDVVSVSLAPGLGPTAALVTSTVVEGDKLVLVVEVSGLQGLTASATTLVHVQAEVPLSAPYAGKQLLDLRNVLIDESVVGVDDDGVHVVAYFGDTTGNGGYSSLDLSRLQAVVLGTDTGFDAFQLVDPVLMGDITGNGGLSSLDTSRLSQWIRSGRDPAVRPEFEVMPATPVTIIPGGPDPLVNVAGGLSGRPGEQVTVPLNLDTAAGFESVQAQLSYDAASLELISVRPGSLTDGFEFVVQRQEAGLLYVDMASMQALPGGTGSLIQVDFRIKPEAKPGPTALDLQWVSLNEGGLTLNPAPEPGLDSTDGQVLIQAAPSARPAVVSSTAAKLQALTLEQQRIRPVAQAERSIPAAPVIDWTASAQPVLTAALKDGSQRVSDWRGDFVGNLARGDDDDNPNRKMRVTLPTAGKVAASIGKLKQP
jgi:hypothetical protein